VVFGVFNAVNEDKEKSRAQETVCRNKTQGRRVIVVTGEREKEGMEYDIQNRGR